MLPMTDAVGVINGFDFYLKKNGAGWHADLITTGYLFVNVCFRLFCVDEKRSKKRNQI